VVFISPTTKPTVGEGCCRWAHQIVRYTTGHYPVRQPHHPTVRVLKVSTIGALTSWGTGQSGAAPDRHCSLFGAPSGAALTLRELSVHCSCSLFTFADDHWRSSRCSAWCTRQSGDPPDGPVNYSGAASEKPEVEEFRVYGSWCTGHCSVAHRTVRCARLGHTLVFFCSFLLIPNLFFLLVCVEPMAPIEHIT
jgi:hypothetical protein